jgi:hypothetical protein
MNRNPVIAGVTSPAEGDAILAAEKADHGFFVAGIAMGRFCKRRYQILLLATMATNLYAPDDSYYWQDSQVFSTLNHYLHKTKVAKAPAVIALDIGTPRKLAADLFLNSITWQVIQDSNECPPRDIRTTRASHSVAKNSPHAIRSTLNRSGAC